MRKFNFNNFKKNNSVINEPAVKPEKPRYSAYRTIISKHDQVNQRLQDEPRAVIPDNN